MRSRDYVRLLRRKYTCEEIDGIDPQLAEARENFDRLLEEKSSATINDVLYVPRDNVGVDLKGEKIRVNIIDASKNDQKTNDEKYIGFSWSVDVKAGDQVYWDDTWWILYHKEHNAVQYCKTFTAKQCNFIYTPTHKGITYHFPCALINLTLYSDGMADKVYMSNQDGSRKIIMTENQHTKDIGAGQRIMISNNSVFEIAHIDDFTRPGVKECILSQVFRTSKDDTENNDAYNENNVLKENGEIIGSDCIYLGGNDIYTVNKELVDMSTVINWRVEAKDDCVWLDTSYNGCRIICTDDISYRGTIIKLILGTRYGDIVKEIKVKGIV